MAFASVRNPAPSRGGPGVPPAPSRASLGLPSAGSLQPNIRSQVPGIQTNGSVNVGILCRPWTSGWQNHYKVGDLLFVHAEESHGSSPMHRVANLPVLNECLSNREGVVADPDKWHFFGVLVSVMDQGNQQRLFSVTVQGRANVANYWDYKNRALQPLDRLFLVPTPKTARTLVSAVNGGSINLGADKRLYEPLTVRGNKAHNAEGKETDITPAQLIDAGAIEIGFVGIRPHGGGRTSDEKKKACYVQERSDKLKRIEVFLRM